MCYLAESKRPADSQVEERAGCVPDAPPGLGNRLTRHDAVSGQRVEHDYDVPLEPSTLDYPTHNNRLIECRVYGSDSRQIEHLLRTVRYVYYETGDAANIIVNDEYVDATTSPAGPNDCAWYNSLATYGDGGHNLRIVPRDGRKRCANGHVGATVYRKLAAREFRVGSVREGGDR